MKFRKLTIEVLISIKVEFSYILFYNIINFIIMFRFFNKKFLMDVKAKYYFIGEIFVIIDKNAGVAKTWRRNARHGDDFDWQE